MPPSRSTFAGYRWPATAVVIVVAVAVWMVWPSRPRVVFDLVANLAVAVEQRPQPQAFSVIDAVQDGAWQKAIYVAEPSRLVWMIDVPDKAWLAVDLGVREPAWMRENPGVLFVITIRPGSGTPLDETSLVVNPFANPADRMWKPVRIDLTPWAGQSIQLGFETRHPVEGGDAIHHLALWGSARIER